MLAARQLQERYLLVCNHHPCTPWQGMPEADASIIKPLFVQGSKRWGLCFLCKHACKTVGPAWLPCNQELGPGIKDKPTKEISQKRPAVGT